MRNLGFWVSTAGARFVPPSKEKAGTVCCSMSTLLGKMGASLASEMRSSSESSTVSPPKVRTGCCVTTPRGRPACTVSSASSSTKAP